MRKRYKTRKRVRKPKPKVVKIYNIHHRKPRCRGGNDSSRNTIEVKVREHNAYHLLFGVHHPKMVANILNETWIDPDYYLIAVKRGTEKNMKFIVVGDQHV